MAIVPFTRKKYTKAAKFSKNISLKKYRFTNGTKERPAARARSFLNSQLFMTRLLLKLDRTTEKLVPFVLSVAMTAYIQHLVFSSQ